ncbi:FAD dependent oxidoreductase-domain-containing protein [Phaeosphaeria sp. MPI-PUGE-AT-0046c]|nr:FAD dependent oxidoreductase-domain-containing protein [Phaeosphaeria sp. MPI-PUGE-AT-0046c]
MTSRISLNPSIGAAPSVTTRKTPGDTLNVDDYASTPRPSESATSGFPKQTGQSLSYWLQQVRCDPLLDHRTTPDLPDDADTVIIGSGLSGTLIASHHLSTFPSKTVVILEAREFCSGATGRNAGHCKPDQWRHYAKFEAAYGAEQAVKIMENEAATWKALVEYVQENEVDCDLWIGDTLDVPVTDEVAKTAKEMFERYKAAGGKVGHITVTHDPDEAVKMSRIKSAKACYSWSASTLQPWKLTASLMRTNVEKAANLQTHTLVTSVSPTQPGDGEKRKWVVHTERGDVKCDSVVHATNAYAAAIEPSLKGVISPKPHVCNQFIPPRELSGSKALKNSYGVLLPDGALFSINPRASSDGSIMFGGSNPGQKKLDEWSHGNTERSVDDGLANVEIVTKEVREFVRTEFLGGGMEGGEQVKYAPGEGFVYSWSGIIGLSADGVPFVGEIPGKEGQWICAGHHGHGMARIFTAAPGLVKLMNGAKWSETGLVDVYQMTLERLEKLKKEAMGTERIAVI